MSESDLKPDETAAAVTTAAADEKLEPDEDLEDGEIDDDDDDEPIVVSETKAPTTAASVPANGSPLRGGGGDSSTKPTSVVDKMKSMIVIDLVGESPSKKSKKPEVLDDDFDGNIQRSIEAALIKGGIVPPKPSILSDRDDLKDNKTDTGSGQSKSSRRRKRKKANANRDGRKDDGKMSPQSQQKRPKLSSPDNNVGGGGVDDDNGIDESEMLCVRGGSPPRLGQPLPDVVGMMPQSSVYYDSDDSYTSYESYDSYEDRRRNRKNEQRAKERRKERERERGRRDRNEKRNKRNRSDDSDDDKHHEKNQPRKLELCKFYLMDCCAKKEKCSYMHSDFPCKYYYLGMDCVYKDECKFSHGAPLTDTLRNILLKHIETAPKEILGTFRRISRENAISLLSKTHAKLCNELGVINTQAQSVKHTNTLTNTQANMLAGATLPSNNNAQETTQATKTGGIPSLLDMVIRPPTADELNPKSDKPARKTRWRDNTPSPIAAIQASQQQQLLQKLIGAGGGGGGVGGTHNLPPPPPNAPAYLNLCNLHGHLNPEHINKLTAFGIVNLEQINLLTVGQLNSIGLSVLEVGEILGKAKSSAESSSSISTNSPSAATETAPTPKLSPPAVGQFNHDSTGFLGPSSQDVDMRFPPSCVATTDTTTTTTANTSTTLNYYEQQQQQQQKTAATEQNHTSSSISIVDYSQYLKDSNLDTDKGYFNDSLLEDKEDDEKLVIADDNELQIDEAVDDDERQSQDTASEDHTIDLADGSIDSLHLPPALPPVAYDPRSIMTSQLNKVNLSNLITSSNEESPPKDQDTRQLHIPAVTIASPLQQKPKISSLPLPPGYLPYCDDSNSNSSNRSATPPAPSPSPPPATTTSKIVTKYERASMYDGSALQPLKPDRARMTSQKGDCDMRLSSFTDPTSNDVDLRMPFKSVMTNYTPASEIDASLLSHPPMVYSVYEVDIPKPNYSEIVRSTPDPDSSLDPRLRRIFSLAETSSSVNHRQRRVSSPGIESPPPSAAYTMGYRPGVSETTVSTAVATTTSASANATAAHSSGPRLDPRRKASTGALQSAPVVPLSTATGQPVSSTQPNMDIRVLLQTSNWYKNLSSKFKIMVNQQLALVTTELKKFHQDPSPNKVFDIQFIVSNQTLQQILTSLNIFIDDNGQIQQVEDEDNGGGGLGGGNSMFPMDGEFGGGGGPGPGGPFGQMQMDYMHGPPQGNNMFGGQRFGGGGGDNNPNAGMRPGLLGIAPAGFNPFAVGPMGGGDGGPGGNNFYNPRQNDRGGPPQNRNFNRPGGQRGANPNRQMPNNNSRRYGGRRD